MGETLGSPTVSTKLGQIAEAARQHPERAFTTLAHHIDIDWLREAHRRTRKDGAVGIDGQTADEYATNLEQNLQSLLDRFKSGAYRAPPVRRVYIPKGSDGKQTRPIMGGGIEPRKPQVRGADAMNERGEHAGALPWGGGEIRQAPFGPPVGAQRRARGTPGRVRRVWLRAPVVQLVSQSALPEVAGARTGQVDRGA